MRTHPCAEAVYEIVALAASGFGVKVSTSGASPATVSRFETAAAAEAWIAAHTRRVESQSQPRTVFRKTGQNRRGWRLGGTDAQTQLPL